MNTLLYVVQKIMKSLLSAFNSVEHWLMSAQKNHAEPAVID